VSRERDVRNAIKTALVATNLFTDVRLQGMPEDYGAPGSDLTLAVIEPQTTTSNTGWDAQLAGGIDFRFSRTLDDRVTPTLQSSSVSREFSAAPDVGWAGFIESAGEPDFIATLNVVLLVRKVDPQTRDEQAEQLLDALHNAVNGVSLAGFTVPGKTYVRAWTWDKPQPPERRIRIHRDRTQPRVSRDCERTNRPRPTGPLGPRVTTDVQRRHDR
jgi:hypothetical protein